MDQVGVPIQARPFAEKWRIALALLDEFEGEVPFSALTFDAAYGSNRDFLAALDDRDLYFAGQTSCDQTYWDADLERSPPSTESRVGSPQKYDHIADRRRRPKSARQWADELFADPRNVKHLTLPLKSGGRATYVARRVCETKRPQPLAVGAERWLIIERLDDGTYKYYVSNLPRDTSPRRVLLTARERWKVEQGYQQLKEELGLDHFEGRSWRGLHHHLALTFMAYDFLQILLVNGLKKKRWGGADPAADTVVAQCSCKDRSLSSVREPPGVEATPHP